MEPEQIRDNSKQQVSNLLYNAKNIRFLNAGQGKQNLDLNSIGRAGRWMMLRKVENLRASLNEINKKIVRADKEEYAIALRKSCIKVWYEIYSDFVKLSKKKSFLAWIGFSWWQFARSACDKLTKIVAVDVSDPKAILPGGMPLVDYLNKNKAAPEFSSHKKYISSPNHGYIEISLPPNPWLSPRISMQYCKGINFRQQLRNVTVSAIDGHDDVVQLSFECENKKHRWNVKKSDLLLRWWLNSSPNIDVKVAQVEVEEMGS